MSQDEAEYSTWGPDKLLLRVRSLEQRLKAAHEELYKLRGAEEQPLGKPTRPPRPYDPSRYSTRLIALKFAYLGQNYNGFEHHNNNTTPLPTIEEVMWKALAKARLINPHTQDSNTGNLSWDGCDYSKCGRTDRGVSAFGQVIGIRVRSNRPVAKTESIAPKAAAESGDAIPVQDLTGSEDGGIHDLPEFGVESGEEPTVDQVPEFDDIRDEVPYHQILNRLLPPDVRVLAWCPAPADFSARFSCRERRYRYFFTQPAFTPYPGAPGYQNSPHSGDGDGQRRNGWLDIEAMKVAAKKYEGLHDFRNLCKVDGSKQIDNFMRRIFVSEIREVDAAEDPAAYVAGREFAELGNTTVLSTNTATQKVKANAPKVYQFVLHGSAFLWHQVRCMVAILFLVGQGLEQPSLVDQLLDPEAAPCRPKYEMADDAPLVLWDCVFPEEGSESREDALPWVWLGREDGDSGTGKFGSGGLVDELWGLWRKRKIDEVLAGSLLNLAVTAGGVFPPTLRRTTRGEHSTLVFRGGNGPKQQGNYVPVMQLEKMESVEVINAKYRERKGIEPKVPTHVKEQRTDHV